MVFPDTGAATAAARAGAARVTFTAKRGDAMRIDGGCHCGAITYEAEIDPATASMCHCDDCQSFSGAPYRASIQVKAENFTLRGDPTIYIKTADSGRRRAQGFCGTCGSPIFATSETDRVQYNIRLGGVRQRAQLPPRRQIWCDSAMPWIGDLAAIPAQPRDPN
jgi:hypothetical protein